MIALSTYRVDYSGYRQFPKILVIRDQRLVDIWKIRHFCPSKYIHASFYGEY